MIWGSTQRELTRTLEGGTISSMQVNYCTIVKVPKCFWQGIQSFNFKQILADWKKGIKWMIFRFWNAGNSYSCVEKSPANHMIIIVVDGWWRNGDLMKVMHPSMGLSKQKFSPCNGIKIVYSNKITFNQYFSSIYLLNISFQYQEHFFSKTKYFCEF